MSYIGNTPTGQAFTPAIDYFNGNGSTVAFTLSRPVASAAQVQAVIENVPQNPNSAFTVSGNTITFTSAPPSGTANIYVYYTSPITSVATLSQAPSVIGPMSVSIGGATGIGGATNPIVNMSGASSNYVQAYVNNTTNGSSSSADIVAYANNSTDSHGWADMGFTSSSYADTTYTVTGPNEAYLFGSAPSGSGATGNLVIATDNTGTANSIQFYTNGFTQAKSAAKMVIDGSTGNVGIGTSSPSYKLHSLSYGYTIAGVFQTDTTGAYVTLKDATTASVTSCRIGVIGENIVFLNNGAGEKMRIDSSGNLLVGDTSAISGAAGLQVGVGKQLILNNGTSSNPTTISNNDAPLIYASGAGGAFGFNGHLVLQPRGSAAGAIIMATGNGVGAMTERVRVDSSGNFILTAAGNINLNTLNTYSASANGYQKLPSGVIMQWGIASNSSGTSIAVTFPIAFPTACTNVQATMQVNATGASYAYASKVQSYSASGATIWANNTFFWFALGY